MEDVKTILNYRCLFNDCYFRASGLAPWQFERIAIYIQHSNITRVERKGKCNIQLTKKNNIPLLFAGLKKFYEKRFKKSKPVGHMAQVWSAYEVKQIPEIRFQIRG